MSGYWWVAVFQFIICGLTGMFALTAPKFHFFPKSDRPYLLGIAMFLFTFSLIGLMFMTIHY